MKKTNSGKIRVLMGFNVKLEPGENWDGRVVEVDEHLEARLEPGDEVEELPAGTAVEWLREIGAIALTPTSPPTPLLPFPSGKSGEGGNEVMNG